MLLYNGENVTRIGHAVQWEMAREERVKPHQIELEINEQLFMDPDIGCEDQMRRLREYGFRIALDDFGTGYSNLGYLKKFEVSTLKIDQSFVRGILTSKRDASVIRAIIDMARSFDLETIAEGIETEAELAILKGLNCEFAQGYLWCPALPAPVFAERYLQHEGASTH